MKLVTAEEVRKTPRDDEEPVARAIAAINARLKDRHKAGHTAALIGFDEHTQCFAELPARDRTAITRTLSMAGFKVTNGPHPATIRADWTDYQDPE